MGYKLPLKRLIARLDIKGQNVIKGIQFEGLRVIGAPQQLANKYYDEGADELLLIDSVASLYQRDNILNIVEETAEEIFIPLTVGGGIRTLSDAKKLLLSGADKVAINSAAVMRPELLNEIAQIFGSQCVVLSVEAKQNGSNWEVYTNNGREPSGINVLEWVSRARTLGVGEVLITSVDRDGTKKGLDNELMKKVREVTDLPLIGCGGIGANEGVLSSFEQCQLEGIAMASALHSKKIDLMELRTFLKSSGVPVRNIG
jgi:cyclase